MKGDKEGTYPLPRRWRLWWRTDRSPLSIRPNIMVILVQYLFYCICTNTVWLRHTKRVLPTDRPYNIIRPT